jgi:AcrR family transcriptional regulator
MAAEDRRGRSAALSAEDWAQAALTAIGEGGLAAVAVEPLAARLGATKGSFYWHFRNRQALIEAALAVWEREHTEQVIALTDAEPDPADRLRRLFTLVVGVSRQDRIETALLATADEPLVAPVVRRVTQRRIDHVASVFEQLGLSPEQARQRAVLAVSVYLGHVQIARAAPDALPPVGAPWQRHLTTIVDAVLADLPS